MNNKLKASAMDSVTELQPKIKRARSTFNLGIKHYTSFNLGELFVVDFTEVLPGDTFNVNLNSFIRLTSTAKRATMDNLHADLYAFFCPYRFLDKAWVNIQGESSDPWYTAPGSCSRIGISGDGSPSLGIEAGSLLNQLGLPIGTITGPSGSHFWFNAYPVLTYFKLINDWFRDQNLQAEIPFDTTNGDYDVITDIAQINGAYINEKGSLFKVAKYHDLFTSALPAPQKGPAVSLLKAEGKAPVGIIPASSGTTSTSYPVGLGSGVSVTANKLQQITMYGGSGEKVVADVAEAYVTTINELRLAFQLQKAYELDARSGTRYTEALEARFDVKNPDLRLGRSELLGHYRFDLNMAELASTTNSGTSGATIADLKGSSYINGVGAGASKTGNSQHICVKTFLEHGIFMIVGCIRPDLTYQQGIDKFWRKKERWDFYEPIFSNIGEVPIMKSELYPVDYALETDDSVFGYQEAWYDYRYKVSKISGCLASDSNEGFDIFHYGQDFNSAPVLSSTFIQQDKAALDRTLAFTSSAVDQFIAQFQGVIKATRVMPLFSVPGLIDHF